MNDNGAIDTFGNCALCGTAMTELICLECDRGVCSNCSEEIGTTGFSMCHECINNRLDLEEDVPLDGDAESALGSIGWGDDEYYGYYGDDEG